MISISDIKTGMVGVNGWKQSLLSGAPVIDATNLASSSGALYNQDFSALVTVDNILKVYETEGLTDEQVNTLLEDIVKGAAVKVLNAVFNDDDFVQNDLLYPYEYDFDNLLDNDTSFVGYEIEIASTKELLNIINNISLVFNGVDTVKVLLFHSTKKAPVKTQEITTQTDNEVTQDLTDWKLPYVNSVNGGRWYLGYLRSGLTAQAYDREYELANVRTVFCGCRFYPMKVDGHNTETLFDVNDVEHVSETWGMNFDVSTFKYYDSIILNNKNKFSKALGLQVAATVLDMIANSVSSNRIERTLRQDATIQLEGMSGEHLKSIGILGKLEKEIKSLRKIFVDNKKISIDTLS